MKTILTCIALTAVASLIGAACSCRSKMPSNPAPAGRLVSYEYGEYGMMAQPNRAFSIKLNDDKATATLVVSGMSDLLLPGMNWDDPIYEQRVMQGGDTITVPAATLDSIAHIILEHKMYNYEEHYDPPFEVMDGTSWHYQAQYDDETYLSSGGHEAGPGDNGMTVINDMLKKIYQTARLTD